MFLDTVDQFAAVTAHFIGVGDAREMRCAFRPQPGERGSELGRSDGGGPGDPGPSCSSADDGLIA